MFPPNVHKCNLVLTCNIDRKTIKMHQRQAKFHKSDQFPFPDFELINGIVHKNSDHKILPLIPDSLVNQIIFQFHGTVMGGHLGVDKTLVRLQTRVYFPHMQSKVKEYVRTCDICQRIKYDNKKPTGFMRSAEITNPWEEIYMYIMGPYTKSAPGNYVYILVVIDGFTKWTEIFPLTESSATKIGKVLEEQLLCRLGMPRVLVSDNGSYF